MAEPASGPRREIYPPDAIDAPLRHRRDPRARRKPVGKKRPMKLKSGDGLCDALRGVRVINIGDSLTHQLVETWRVCRVLFPRLLDPSLDPRRPAA